MTLFGLSISYPTREHGDVRDLTVREQWYAYHVTLPPATAVAMGEQKLTLSQALDELELKGDEAARFARLYGEFAGLVFDERECCYVERAAPEWRRRNR